MAQPGEFEPLDPTALAVLPRSHIYVVSIDDSERLMSAVRRQLINLPAFLAECVADDANSSTMKFAFNAHFEKIKGQLGYSALVESAYDAATQRVMGQLGQANPVPDGTPV
jgi:hypothetical protein